MLASNVYPRGLPNIIRNGLIKGYSSRFINTTGQSTSSSSDAPLLDADSSSSSSPNTHYKITLMRSAIGLVKQKKLTLESLGIHRRMQTVYHRHSPECAGKILAVKELVEVENVPASAVRTKSEQREERKASRGFQVLGGLEDRNFS